MTIPRHVAIILGRNGRWPKSKGARTYGHIKGCENLEKNLRYYQDLGVKYLTVYGIFGERKRSKEEVDGLMKLFRNYMKRCIQISEIIKCVAYHW